MNQVTKHTIFQIRPNYDPPHWAMVWVDADAEVMRVMGDYENSEIVVWITRSSESQDRCLKFWVYNEELEGFQTDIPVCYMTTIQMVGKFYHVFQQLSVEEMMRKMPHFRKPTV